VVIVTICRAAAGLAVCTPAAAGKIEARQVIGGLEDGGAQVFICPRVTASSVVDVDPRLPEVIIDVKVHDSKEETHYHRFNHLRRDHISPAERDLDCPFEENAKLLLKRREEQARDAGEVLNNRVHVRRGGSLRRGHRQLSPKL